MSATDSRLVLDWYLFFYFFKLSDFELRFFLSEEMVESVFRSNAQRSNAERYVKSQVSFENEKLSLLEICKFL